MLKVFAYAAAALMIVAANFPVGAAPKNTPGHLMQQRGPVPGHPGASGYAPGHLKKNWHVRSARSFAPGRHHVRKHHPVRYVHHHKRRVHHAYYRRLHRTQVAR